MPTTLSLLTSITKIFFYLKLKVIASGIQPLQNLIVLIHVGEEKKKEWAQHWIMRGFRATEKLLSACSGKYCVADEITLADCCLVPQVFNARRYGFIPFDDLGAAASGLICLMCVCKRCGTNIYSFLISYTVIGSYCAVFFFVRIKLFMYMVGI